MTSTSPYEKKDVIYPDWIEPNHFASIDQRESRNGPPGRRMSKFRLICRSAIVIVTWSGFSALGTVYNSDGTAAGVQYLHDNFAQDGDTITLPAGTFYLVNPRDHLQGDCATGSRIRENYW